MSKELKLAVKCPACNHTRLQTLRQIKAQTHFTCHDCGHQVTLKTNAEPAAKQENKTPALADAV